MPQDSRERLAAAAFRLFAEEGFDATTVDQIADAAGVSRRTFFRHFATKEDVVFPDHDRLLAAVAADLDTRRHEPPLTAVCHSVRLVLGDYVRNRDASLLRFALTRQVAALREREVTSVHRYQRLFVRHLRARAPGDDDLRLELMAAAVVAAHNATLRHWLQSGGDGDPFVQLDQAFAVVAALFHEPATAGGTVVAVFRSDAPLASVVDQLRRADRLTAVDRPDPN